MDSSGARILAARISAGVRIGSVIELLRDPGDDSLAVGDRGVVRAVSPDGRVMVRWERGFEDEIDPMAVRPVSA